MNKTIDLVGKRFGKLIVLERAENKRYKNTSLPMWLCQCDCGNTKIISGQNLRLGKTKSCGCMWRKAEDLTGKRYGKLTVIKRTDNHIDKSGKTYVMWACKCDCGNKTIVRGENLRYGITKSCGCLWHEKYDNNHPCKKHGDSYTRLYKIWQGMRIRCNRPDMYERYAGRGIKVCDEWRDYLVFKEWSLSHGYNDSLKIDRIDNDGDYEPDNCRWTTDLVQSNNRSVNKYLEYNNEIKTLAEWCRELSLNHNTVLGRLNRGWCVEDAFEVPILKYGDTLEKHKTGGLSE